MDKSLIMECHLFLKLKLNVLLTYFIIIFKNQTSNEDIVSQSGMSYLLLNFIKDTITFF